MWQFTQESFRESLQRRTRPGDSFFVDGVQHPLALGRSGRPRLSSILQILARRWDHQQVVPVSVTGVRGGLRIFGPLLSLCGRRSIDLRLPINVVGTDPPDIAVFFEQSRR